MSEVEDAVRTLEGLNPKSELYRETLARLLGRLDPRAPAGTKLCDAIMKLWPTPAFEAVALRRLPGREEVFLRQRAQDDTAFPGQWHCPGSLYRAHEGDRVVANRLEREFGVGITSFHFVGKLVFPEDRGTVHSLIFLVELAGEPVVDARHFWYGVNELPIMTVETHRQLVIPPAIDFFRTWR